MIIKRRQFPVIDILFLLILVIIFILTLLSFIPGISADLQSTDAPTITENISLKTDENISLTGNDTGIRIIEFSPAEEEFTFPAEQALKSNEYIDENVKSISRAYDIYNFSETHWEIKQ